MKDKFNNIINVGDKVVAFNSDSCKFYEGIINSIGNPTEHTFYIYVNFPENQLVGFRPDEICLKESEVAALFILENYINE